MVSLRRRRLLGLDLGKHFPLRLYCENIPPIRKRTQKRKIKTENGSSDTEGGFIPDDRMSSSNQEAEKLKGNKASKENSGQGSCNSKDPVPVSSPFPAASSSSRKKNKIGEMPSLPEVKVETNEEEPVVTSIDVVGDNYTKKTEKTPFKLFGKLII